MASYIPTTKEILREHLHHKVSDALRNYFSKEFLHNVPWSPADKVTGTLLERSVPKINQMLTDQMFLLDNISESLAQIANEIFLQNLSTTDSKYLITLGMSLTYTELGEILYHKIKKLGEINASQLTGMLLDLELKSLVQILTDDNLLKVAVKKAKRCISSYEPDSPPDTEKLLKETPSATCTFTNNRAFPVCVSCEADEYKESVGLHIYSEVFKSHSNSHLASKITGMILEMESSALQEIVSDKKLLHLAIDKAYTALKSYS